MRFSTILISSVFAALSVNAQNNGTATISSAVVSGTESATPAQESATQCLKTCSASDSKCRADCQLLANSVNPIADCQTKCPKGDGSAAGNKSYEECYQGCISTAALTPTAAAGSQKTSSEGAAEATNKPTGTESGSGSEETGSGSSSETGSGSGSKSTGGAETGASQTGTGTGSAAAPTETTGAAGNLKVSVAACAVLGAFAVMFAL